jgi:hypothetical protein
MVRKVLAFGLVSALTALANAQIVTNLEQGGKIFWKFNSGRYAISGAISDAGNVTASDPVELTLRDLNNDGRKLDVLLDLGELGLDIDYVLPLVGSVVSQDANEAIIEWYANVTPNQCVTVNIRGTEVQVLVTRLEGKLRGRVTPIACQTNPYNPGLAESDPAVRRERRQRKQLPVCGRVPILPPNSSNIRNSDY